MSDDLPALDPAWLKEDLGQDLAAPLVSRQGSRSAAELRAVVAQFCVATAKRYAKRDVTGDGVAETFCNFFVRDVLFAMNCPIPLKLANAFSDWFMKAQSVSAWTQVRPWVARELAERGCAVVVIWENPGGPHGHVAIVVPSRDELDRETIHIAQAGGENFEYGRLEDGFGQRAVTFYAHP